MENIDNQFATSILKDELIANDFHPLGREVKKFLAVNSSFFEIESYLSVITLSTNNINTLKTFIVFSPDTSD